MLTHHVVVERHRRKRRAIERRRRVARRRRQPVAEHVRHDDEVLRRIDRAAFGHHRFHVGVMAGVEGRHEHDVVACGAQRPVRLVGELRLPQRQPGLQHDVAELEHLVIRHSRVQACAITRNRPRARRRSRDPRRSRIRATATGCSRPRSPGRACRRYRARGKSRLPRRSTDR